MEIVRELRAPVDATTLFAHVDDLDAYAGWMPLIHEVSALDVETGALPAWSVELQAQVGPFARSKRLRMVRTELVPDRVAVFERREEDGKAHSSWILRADLTPGVDAASTDLTMTLSYGGSLWSGAVLQRVLDDQVRRGSDALLALVS